MKTKAFILTLLTIAAAAVAVNSGLTGCAADGTLTPAAQADAANVETALQTAANVLQQLNNGLQSAAPTVDALLTLTHNQGDAAAVNNIVATTNAAAPALTALLANVNTAIKAATTPAAQQAAVNAALSPAAISQIVAPIAAAGTPTSSIADPSKDQGICKADSILKMDICSASPGEVAQEYRNSLTR